MKQADYEESTVLEWLRRPAEFDGGWWTARRLADRNRNEMSRKTISRVLERLRTRGLVEFGEFVNDGGQRNRLVRATQEAPCSIAT